MATEATSYDWIVLGSTLAGLSATVAAARRGQRVLLVEAGTIAGYDAVETLAAARGWALATQAQADAQAFAAELHAAAAARKIIVGDRCDLAAFSCRLQDFLAQSGAQALYMTDVTAVAAPAPAGSSFRLTLSNRSGIQHVTADRLIDATVDAVSLRALGVIQREQPADRWAFRGLLIGVDLPAAESPATPPTTGAVDLTVAPGRYPSDLIVELHGRGAAPTIGAARVAFLQRIAALREQAAWKPYTVAALANLVAATPRFDLARGALERLETAGLTLPAAWQTPALADAPWAAVAAGVQASSPSLAAAR